jgi:transcriptional regulator GlxA family with amidase domain
MLTSDAKDRLRNYAFVLLPRFSSLTVSNLVEPLRIANYCAGKLIYQWQFVSVDGQAVLNSADIAIPTMEVSPDNDFDTIFVCGGWNSERFENLKLTHWLQQMSRSGRTLGAVETGTYVLARAHLLSGYAATVHWHCHTAFEETFTDIKFKDALFVIDRQRMTAAGGVACLDMMLHLIGQQHGRPLALEVAEQLVYFPRREGDTPQKKIQAGHPAATPPELQRAIEAMNNNIEKPIAIPELSRALGFSQRKLERLFKKHFGCSAVAFYRTLRLHEARVLLTHTDMSVLDICIACGFASSSYFSKSYTSQFGMRPRDHRTSWPENEPLPFWPGISKATAAEQKP